MSNLISSHRILVRAATGTAILASATGCAVDASDMDSQTATVSQAAEAIRLQIPPHMLKRLDISNALGQILMSQTATKTYLRAPEASLQVLGVDPSTVDVAALTNVVRDLGANALRDAQVSAYSNTSKEESVGANKNFEKNAYEQRTESTFAEKNFNRDSVGRDFESRVLDWVAKVDLLPLVRPGTMERISATQRLRGALSDVKADGLSLGLAAASAGPTVVLQAHHIKYWEICRLIGDLATDSSLQEKLQNQAVGYLSSYGLGVDEVNLDFILKFSENLRKAYSPKSVDHEATNLDGLPAWVSNNGLLEELTPERLAVAIKRPEHSR